MEYEVKIALEKACTKIDRRFGMKKKAALMTRQMSYGVGSSSFGLAKIENDAISDPHHKHVLSLTETVGDAVVRVYDIKTLKRRLILADLGAIVPGAFARGYCEDVDFKDGSNVAPAAAVVEVALGNRAPEDAEDYRPFDSLIARRLKEAERAGNATMAAKASEPLSAYERKKLEQAKAARASAKTLGGKALKGSIRQKAFAEDIRKSVLARATPDAAKILIEGGKCQQAKWWIENRELLGFNLPHYATKVVVDIEFLDRAF